MIKYSNNGMGMLKMAFDRTKTKKRFGRTITKTIKANTYTDFKKGMFTGSGTKTKTVVGPRVNKVKTTNLSKRRLMNLK